MSTDTLISQTPTTESSSTPNFTAATAWTTSGTASAAQRLESIEKLPPGQQSLLLRTIDTFLENAELKSAWR